MSMNLMRGDILGVSVGTSEIENGAITKVKLNADIVGIDGTTGKVNDINSTNFKSLNGINLTNVGSLVKIADVTQPSAGGTMYSDTIDVSSFKTILMIGKINTSISKFIRIAINEDTTVNNYDGCYVNINSDTHAVSANSADLGVNWVNHFVYIIINNDIGGKKQIISMDTDANAGASGQLHTIAYQNTGNITKLGFTCDENIIDTSTFSIYGIV